MQPHYRHTRKEKQMNRFSVRACGAVLAALVLAPAAAAQAPLPPAQQLVDRYVQAIGGRDAYHAHRSVRMTAKFELPAMGMSAEMTSMQKQPNMMRQVVTIPGMGEMQSGYDGDVAWTLDPMQGARLLDGAELQQARDQSAWGAATRDRELIQEMQTVERTEVAGTACYKVRIVWKSGREQHDCYATDTGLLMATMTRQESQMGQIEVQTRVMDYKEFGGVKMPTRIMQEAGPQQVIITIGDVEFDTVTAEELAPPAQIKALKEQRGG
jgi:hypothetical protein